MKTIAVAAILTFINMPFVYGQNAQPLQVQAGQKLFIRHCAECHGQGGKGTSRAPSIGVFVRQSETAGLQSFIKNGNLRKGMPSWSRLPDQQMRQLVEYLKAVNQTEQ